MVKSAANVADSYAEAIDIMEDFFSALSINLHLGLK
jgi:hypothetical protein